MDTEITEYNENGDPIDMVYDDEEQLDHEIAYKEKYYPYTSLTFEEKEALLYQRMSRMNEDDYNMFLKVLRYDTLDELMDAMTNLKNTSEQTWKNIISKLQFLLKFDDTETSKFDFNKLLRILLPLIAMLAGLLIGMRKAELADSQSSDLSDETLNDPIFKKMIDAETDTPYSVSNSEDTDIDQLTGKLKSVVLDKCKKLVGGFS